MTRSCSTLLIAVLSTIPFGVFEARAAEPIQFNRDIRGLLFDRCVACHGPDEKQRKAELRLDVEEAAKEWVIVPGEPDESELITRITDQDPEIQMPPPESGKSLTAEEIALLTRWVAEGAEWQPHWAFIPPERPPLPDVTDDAWVNSEIDHFVLARLEEAGKGPSPQASREQLLRRVTFDLTGLPPTLEQIDTFLADDSPDAYETAVDRLLASTRYGEHLAAGWMQAARFADSNGYQNDFRRSQWPWRDWVIHAFNDNLPCDQFILEQLAGDLLPNPSRSQLVATGFNRNNRTVTEAGSIGEEWRVENNVDRVETTTTVFLGLTMGCCRCHDHKYDPLTQKEFYQLFAFFDALDEQGVYTETRGNVPPMIPLPSPEDEQRLQAFDQQIVGADVSLQSLANDTVEVFLSEARQTLDESLAIIPDVSLPLSGSIEPAFGEADSTYAADEADFEEGLLGPSIVLEGSEQSHVVISGAIAPDRETAFSYSLWVNPERRSSALIGQMEPEEPSRGWDTLLLRDGRLKVHLIHDFPANALDVTSKTALPNGTWSHVAVTYDGSSKAAGVSIYVNGEKSEVDVGSDQLTESFATELPVLLGRRSEFSFKGGLSQFSWFERALTAEEVQSLLDRELMTSFHDNQNDVSGARKRMLKDFLVAVADGNLKDTRDELESLRTLRADYEKDIPTVMIMRDRETPRPTYVLQRGAYDAPDKSEQLSPGVPSIFESLPAEYTPNRLALAHWIIDADNPLTARVQVNRVWQRMFGVGIVKSSENFGVQSEPPSHPELLDWLAVEFIESGWDLKKLHQLIVMSATYQQTSDASPEAIEADPENRLLSRGPRFRLPAEVIRDNALAVSGLLTKKVGGPSVKPYQPQGLWEELAGGANEGDYVPSQGEDLYRRSLYTNRKRTVPHTTMATFDAPTFEYCTVKRSTTNTPLQALALLNDVTYLEAARKMAELMILDGGDSAESRIGYGFRRATSRRPSERETAVLLSGLQTHLQQYQADEAAAREAVGHGESPAADSVPAAELAAYTTVASVILNLDETITKP